MNLQVVVGLVALIAAGGVGVAGCGGSHASSGAATGTPAAAAADGAPAAGGPPGAAHAERVAVSAAACAQGWSARTAGRYRFTVSDHAPGAESVALEQAVSGIALVRARVPAGAARSLSATLQRGGAYRFSCTAAGGTPSYSATVQLTSGAPSAAAASPSPPAVVGLIRPLTLYTRHEDRLLTVVRQRLAALRDRLAAGSLRGARTAWVRAHVAWLQLGQDDLSYGAFGAVGGKIDGPAAGLVGSTASPKFTGFHKVELDLWRRRSLPAARRDTAVLTQLVSRLTPQAVAADLPATVTGLDAWVPRCHEILEDALRDSLTGDDDYGSNTDLASVRADVSASREMLGLLAPLIRPRRPGLVAGATRQLRRLGRALAAAGARRVPIAQLPKRRRQAVDAATGAVLQTLAPVSELMQVGNS